MTPERRAELEWVAAQGRALAAELGISLAAVRRCCPVAFEILLAVLPAAAGSDPTARAANAARLWVAAQMEA